MAKKNKNSSGKLLSQVLEIIKTPWFLGICITFISALLAHTYYQQRSLLEGDRRQQSILKQNVYKVIEFLDQKNMDLRFKVRGTVAPAEQVGLLTADDRSIEEIGRWPWSREKFAFIIDEMMKYGASSIGFDIVFSEPQVDRTLKALDDIEKEVETLPMSVKMAFERIREQGEPDLILAEAIQKYQDKIALGAFNEESSLNYLPYQDYCRNEAFTRANANKFIKLENFTFVVEDLADPFVDLNFRNIFNQIFSVEEKITTEYALKNLYKKESLDALEEREQKQLHFLVEENNLRYCDRWLTEKDKYLEPLKEAYLELFGQSELLQGLDFPSTISQFKASVKDLPIIQHNRWTINTDLFQEQSIYTGSFNAVQDSDGTIRRASMFFRTGNRIGTSYIPSLALQTYLIAKGYRAEVTLDVDPKNPSQKNITKFEIKDANKETEDVVGNIPVDSQGLIKINYAGGRNVYPYLSVKELFNGKETAVISQAEKHPETGQYVIVEKEVNKADFIKDRAFIFGSTAIGVYDLRVTPFDPNYPGPETHVTALGNLFAQNFIRVHPNESTWMILAVMGLGVILSIGISMTTAIPGFLLSFGSMGLFFVIDQWLLSKGLVATIVIPFLLALSLYVLLFFYKYLTEERKKKYLKSTFSKYVSPAIVDEILKDPENIELGGKKMRMSVFFSDVRGFTTISEKLDPQVLSDVLNKYLTPMTNIVFQNKGTLDKYMGDAVMAFFGAPISYPDHAAYACRCALQSLEKLKEINADFQTQGIDPIDIGIGINTSDMSVGNMGSDIVRNYTVMGDAVNLGSRLEGINKEYGTRIIISEFTYSEVKNQFVVREVDWVKVKGKNEPVKIYELIAEGKTDTTSEKLIQSFQKGFDLYHQKNFKDALTHFKACLEVKPEDGPTLVYVERCQSYIENPPPENWDGVYTMKTK